MSTSSAMCGDCGAPEPGWASINRGVLVCDECCSVHRLLGRQISDVRSITHGLWPPSMLEMIMTLVSKGANGIWEHALLDSSSKSGKRKPKAHHPVHPNKYDFITAKYKHQSFVHRHSTKEHDHLSTDDLSQQLHASVRTGILETSLRLLALGAEVNFFHGERGNTPLHVAASAGQQLQVELLVAYSANPCILDRRGHTPVECARIAGYHELADRLFECQYELTDRLAFYLCGRKPDHSSGEHYIIPPLTEGNDVSEADIAARQKLFDLTNQQFEKLAADVYDEVDRRETDAIWLATQNHSKLVSDHHVMPFLPVNPALSSMHNQGRQKLATFSASEFAALLVDILTDTKRRQLESHGKRIVDGTFVPMDFVKSEKNEGGDPDYDDVFAEEIRDSQSDHKADAEALANLAAGNAGEQDDKIPNGEFVKRTDSRRELIKQTDIVNNNEHVERTSEVPKNKKMDSDVAEQKEETVPSANHIENPLPVSTKPDTVPLAKHLETQRKLDIAQARIVQLTKVNERMGEEIKLLQSMFQRLTSENSMLRQMQGKPPPRPAADLPHLTRATTAPLLLPNKPEISGSQLETAEELPENSADGGEREVLSQLDAGSYEKLQEVVSRTTELVTEKQKEMTEQKEAPPSLPVKKKRSRVLSVDTPPPSLSPTSQSAVRAVQKQQVKQHHESGPVNSSLSMRRQQPLPPTLSKTGVDAVVQQTEKITKRIQELLMAAQHGQPANFIPCSRRISSSVNDMASLFPQRPESEPIRAALRLLVSSATRLQQECKDINNATVSSPDVEETPDVAYLTQQVIQSAYDIAKAAKQLVTHSTEV